MQEVNLSLNAETAGGHTKIYIYIEIDIGAARSALNEYSDAPVVIHTLPEARWSRHGGTV